MNIKTWAPLAVALVLGICAMVVARNMMSHGNNEETAQAGSKLLVAKNDLPAGAALSAADVQMTSVNGAVVPQGVFSNTADLEGRVLTSAISKGMPIVEPMLAQKGAGSGLQALIPVGMRAITIEINEMSGVAGNLVPGCHVDVLSTLNGENNDMLSRTIVENLKVQAVGTRAQADAGGPVKSVTLLAKPKEVEAIELAASTGRPRLVLRSGTDIQPGNSDGVTVAELRHGGKSASDPFAVQTTEYVKAGATTQPAMAFTNERKIRIIRGGVETSTTVEEKPAEPAVNSSAPKLMTGGMDSTTELDGDE